MPKSIATFFNPENSCISQKKKQSSGVFQPSESNMYFFDLKVIWSTVLSVVKRFIFYTGMAKIVDLLFEY